MTNPPSPTRAEALLREAIELEAEEIYLQAEGERAKMRYRVSGRIVQKLDGFVPDAQSVFEELKALPTQQVFADENEGMGYFSFAAQERTVWVRLYWFRDESEEAVVVSLLERELGFENLGLSQRDAAILDELISLPRGVVVGCGVTGSGHATTLNILLERLVANGKRVVLLTETPYPRLDKVTQLDIKDEEVNEHMELLAGHFDAFAFSDVSGAEKARLAFNLAEEGHLVLALVHSPFIGEALNDFRESGISRDELRAHFLGGWSQTLVPRSDQQERVGLFHCLGREEAEKWMLEGGGTDNIAMVEAEKKALWRDAEEKIAAGLITREDAERRLSAI